VKRRRLADALHLCVLSSFAIAQPLFEILSRNAQFFAYRRSRPLEILVLVVVLVLAVPALLSAVEALAGFAQRAAGRWLHLFFVAILVTVIVLPLAARMAVPGGIAVAIAAGFGAAAALGYNRTRAVPLLVTVLSPCVVIFPALFLFRAPINDLIFATKLAHPLDASITKASRVPVVMAIFDELSLVSMLDEQHHIDSFRFPNFAALAGQATWYRHATTVADNTDFAVPAILTGKYPVRGLLPRAADYPESLFALVASTHHIVAFETGFHFCPEQLCAETRTDGAIEGWRSLYTDVAILFAHMVLPTMLRDDLPSIDAAWGHFADARDATGQTAVQQPGQRFGEFLSSIRSSPDPALYYSHAALPHVPWQYLPSGKHYGRLEGDGMPRGLKDERWIHDDWAVTQGAQRYLLQAGFVDNLLGQLTARLKTLNMFDEALIVITADHGVGFASGDSRRPLTPSNYADVAAVPLIIKAPFQTTGAISDRNVQSIDILPTIASILGVKLPWKLDGQSTLDPTVAEPPSKAIWYSNAELRMVHGPRVETLYEANARFRSLFSSRTIAAAVRMGPFPALVDRRIADYRLTPSGFRLELDDEFLYEDVDPEGSFVPAMVQGTVSGPASVPLAIAVNGVIQATTRTFREGRRTGFAAFPPESAFVRGRNEVRVFVVFPEADGRLRLAETERQSFKDYTLAVAPGGSNSAVLLKSGKALRMDQEIGAGFIESAEVELKGDKALIVSGWAVNKVERRPADVIVVFEDNKLLYAGRLEVARHDVALEFQSEALVTTGFDYALRVTEPSEFRSARIRVFAVSGRRAFEVPRLRSSDPSR
jgi:hypothetical protein